MDAMAEDAAIANDASVDAGADDARVDNGGAAPRARADCTEPWGWASSPPAAQPPRVPVTLGTAAPLAFGLQDVQYAPAIDRFVGVSVSPPTLRVFDAGGTAELTVVLGAAPTALAVAPDGSRAAVGHAGSVALIDLETGDDTILAFPAGVTDVVDAGGDFIYVTSGNSVAGFVHALYNIEIATGAVTFPSSGGLGHGMPIVLHPSGDRIYVADQLGPRAHFDISNGPAVPVSAADGEQLYACDALYLSADGDQALNGCGAVRHLDDDPDVDLTYKTGLPLPNAVLGAAHSAERGQYAVVFDQLSSNPVNPEPYAALIRSQVHAFGDDYFAAEGAATLPDYIESGQRAPLWGRWVSYSASADELYVIAETPPDSSLPGRLAVVTLPPALAAREPSASVDPDSAVMPLQTSVVDARYSRALDRIVMTSDRPAEITVLDPETLDRQRLPLVREPRDLTLDPSGEHAVVAYDGWVAHYALDPLRLLRLVPVGARVTMVAADDEQYAYSYVGTDGILIVELSTGEVRSSGYRSVFATGYYVAEQQALFSFAAYRIYRLEAHAGTVGAVTESPDDDSTCNEAWFAEDGRAFGACGHVFQADVDMLYRGTLPGFERVSYSGNDYIHHLDVSNAAALVALIPGKGSSSEPPSERVEREVRLYDDPYFARRGTVLVPSFAMDGQPLASFPRFVFFSADGNNLYILVDAAATAALDHDTGIVEVDLGSLALCPDAGPPPIATQGSQSGAATLSPLDFDVVDAELSRALDRIAIVSSDPPAIRLFDPERGQVTASVELPLAATSLSLAPDGLAAIVGHYGWVSKVGLEPLAVEATLPVSAMASDVAVGAAHAYVFPARDQTTTLRTLDLATGLETRTESIRAAQRGRLAPDGLSLFNVPATNTTDEQLRRIDLVAGLPISAPGVAVADGVGHDIWFAEDGARLFGSTGRVFDLQNPQAASLPQLGRLEPAWQVRSLAHSAASGRIAVAPLGNVQAQEAYVLLHDAATYGSAGQRTLPRFMAGGSPVPTSGRFVFFSEDGAELYVIVEAISTQPVAPRFGLVRMPTFE